MVLGVSRTPLTTSSSLLSKGFAGTSLTVEYLKERALLKHRPDLTQTSSMRPAAFHASTHFALWDELDLALRTSSMKPRKNRTYA